MLVILGVFLMIAVFLFAERSGIQYTEKNRKVAYLSQEEVVTEQMAAKSLPKTCLVLRNSEDEASVAAWEQFQQIFPDQDTRFFFFSLYIEFHFALQKEPLRSSEKRTESPACF